MSMRDYRVLSEPIFSKKFEVGYGNHRYWITPMTLELRVNLITHTLYITKSRSKENSDNNAFYNSDVNYFIDNGGVRGEHIRFVFQQTDVGECVIFAKADHHSPTVSINSDTETILAFDAFELRMIRARHLSKVKKLKKEIYNI